MRVTIESFQSQGVVARRTRFVLAAIFLSVLFFFFQNFQSANWPLQCQVLISADGNIRENIDLGPASTKGECLRLVAHKDVIMAPACGTPFQESKAKVILGEYVGQNTDQIPYPIFVAEFQCGQFSHSGHPEPSASTSGDLEVTKNDQVKFEELLNSPGAQVSEDQQMLQGFSKPCPGCYSIVQRRIVNVGRETCHEVAVVEKIESDFGQSLTLLTGQEPEYRCFSSQTF